MSDSDSDHMSDTSGLLGYHAYSDEVSKANGFVHDPDIPGFNLSAQMQLMTACEGKTPHDKYPSRDDVRRRAQEFSAKIIFQL
ncbi:hypothetical protein F53441_1636 [Fusarium austroafricanum]|uniref:Uncharacterized protein n=1 Tax=Fusarium austroafricanum TaxID=2364996 RepID=A0A8H4PCZ4_9HYPO|nr:hypothetical protein F53441_1636 [Fusarium austroafricanum]